jgi:hypothetical protein
VTDRADIAGCRSTEDLVLWSRAGAVDIVVVYGSEDESRQS